MMMIVETAPVIDRMMLFVSHWIVVITVTCILTDQIFPSSEKHAKIKGFVVCTYLEGGHGVCVVVVFLGGELVGSFFS